MSDLSVENCLFYEGCNLIMRMARQQHLQTLRAQAGSIQNAADLQVLERFARAASHVTRSVPLQTRLIWFRETFLLDTSDLRVNLNKETLQELLNEIDQMDHPFNLNVLRNACNEIEQLMFRDTYQRFIFTKIFNGRSNAEQSA
jgi:hypothetical protein